MSAHLTYEQSKKVVFKGLILLGIVTLLEVFIALLGKGYIIDGFHMAKWIMYGSMISLSLYKAYFIVYEFMHLKYEVPGMRKSVLLPLILLVWGIIAFLQEGNAWLISRGPAVDNFEILDAEVAPKGEDAHSIEEHSHKEQPEHGVK